MSCCCHHKCMECETRDVEQQFKQRHYISPLVEAKMCQISSDVPPKTNESMIDYLERLLRIVRA